MKFITLTAIPLTRRSTRPTPRLRLDFDFNLDSNFNHDFSPRRASPPPTIQAHPFYRLNIRPAFVPLQFQFIYSPAKRQSKIRLRQIGQVGTPPGPSKSDRPEIPDFTFLFFLIF